MSYKINPPKLMDVPTLTSGTCPFPILGVLVVFFIFHLSHTDIESKIILFENECISYRKNKENGDTVKLQNDIDQLYAGSGNRV